MEILETSSHDVFQEILYMLSTNTCASTHYTGAEKGLSMPVPAPTLTGVVVRSANCEREEGARGDIVAVEYIAVGFLCGALPRFNSRDIEIVVAS